MKTRSGKEIKWKENSFPASDGIENLYKEALHLFSSASQIISKMEKTVANICNKVQDRKSLEGLDHLNMALDYLDDAIENIEESRDRYGETNIFHLPAEIVKDILQFVSFKDMKKLRLVSRSMYQIVTPLEPRFSIWIIDLNRPCPSFGQILNKSPHTQLYITLPECEEEMKSYSRHLDKASDRIVGLSGHASVIKKLPTASKIVNQLEKLTSVKEDSEYVYSYRYTPPLTQDYNDIIPLLSQNSNSLIELQLSHFDSTKVNNENHFVFKNLKTVHLFDCTIFDEGSDYIFSKCKTTLECLKVSGIRFGTNWTLKIPNDADLLLPNMKKLTIEEDNDLGDYVPRFLQNVCPTITELNLLKVHFCQYEVFRTKLVVKKLYIYNCRIDNFVSLLNVCSSTLQDLHLRQDNKFDDDKVFEPREEYMDIPDIIDQMFKEQFRLETLQHFTVECGEFKNGREKKLFKHLRDGDKVPPDAVMTIRYPSKP